MVAGENWSVMPLSNGVAGIKATANLMCKIVKAYKSRPDIRQLGLNLIADLPPKQYGREAERIMRFVQGRIRYTKDIVGVETLQSPIHTLKIGQGDCDDKSILAATLLETIGHPARFVVVGMMPDSYSHVYVETRIGDAWVPMELTQDWKLGRYPEGIKSRMVFHCKR